VQSGGHEFTRAENILLSCRAASAENDLALKGADAKTNSGLRRLTLENMFVVRPAARHVPVRERGRESAHSNFLSSPILPECT